MADRRITEIGDWKALNGAKCANCEKSLAGRFAFRAGKNRFFCDECFLESIRFCKSVFQFADAFGYDYAVLNDEGGYDGA